MKKKYTEVYLERREVKCILVESDIDATEQEVLEAAEMRMNADVSYPNAEYKAKTFGSQMITNNPIKDVPDFKNWIIATSSY